MDSNTTDQFQLKFQAIKKCLQFPCNNCDIYFTDIKQLYKHKRYDHHQTTVFLNSLCLSNKLQTLPETLEDTKFNIPKFKKPEYLCLFCENAFHLVLDLSEHFIKHRHIIKTSKLCETKVERSKRIKLEKKMIDMYLQHLEYIEEINAQKRDFEKTRKESLPTTTMRTYKKSVNLESIISREEANIRSEIYNLQSQQTCDIKIKKAEEKFHRAIKEIQTTALGNRLSGVKLWNLQPISDSITENMKNAIKNKQHIEHKIRLCFKKLQNVKKNEEEQQFKFLQKQSLENMKKQKKRGVLNNVVVLKQMAKSYIPKYSR